MLIFYRNYGAHEYRTVEGTGIQVVIFGCSNSDTLKGLDFLRRCSAFKKIRCLWDIEDLAFSESPELLLSEHVDRLKTACVRWWVSRHDWNVGKDS